MQYKHARTRTELLEENYKYSYLHQAKPCLLIEEWNANYLKADEKWLGLSGSPTKVKHIDNVILTQKENKTLTASNSDIEQLMRELGEMRIIG